MSETTTPPPRHKEHVTLGVCFALLAALCFSSMSLFGKIIGDKASTETIVFSRFIISLVLILPWALRRPSALLTDVKPMKVIMRSVFTLAGFGCFFYSLKFLSLADALLLNNTFPLFVPIVAFCLLGSKTPHRVWIGIVCGFAGIVLVLHPDAAVIKPASLIGLAGGIFVAVAIVLIRTLTKNISIVQILFYNFLICSILSGIVVPFGWKSLDGKTLWFLLLVGLFGAGYQFFSTMSFAKAPVRLTSPLMYLCIIFGVIADILIWHQYPSKSSIVGMVLVILGGAITIFFGQREITSKK
jgi:drug/metabolite transporter (DMT)-like permease